MASSLKKMHKKGDDMSFGETWSPVSQKHYRPYHDCLQNKSHYLHNDNQIFISGYGEEMEIGINKMQYAIHHTADINELKDGE